MEVGIADLHTRKEILQSSGERPEELVISVCAPATLLIGDPENGVRGELWDRACKKKEYHWSVSEKLEFYEKSAMNTTHLMSSIHFVKKSYNCLLDLLYLTKVSVGGSRQERNPLRILYG